MTNEITTTARRDLAALKAGADVPSFSDATVRLLEAQLEPGRIKTQTQNGRTRTDASGRPLQHIEGWDAIDIANRIFGYAWSRETVQMIEAHEPMLNGERDNVVSTYVAKVRVTIHTATGTIVREGWGDGRSIAKVAGDAVGMAIKSAETDATKRALATLGPQFGLHLYDKDGKVSATRARAVESPRRGEPARAEVMPSARDDGRDSRRDNTRDGNRFEALDSSFERPQRGPDTRVSTSQRALQSAGPPRNGSGSTRPMNY